MWGNWGVEGGLWGKHGGTGRRGEGLQGGGAKGKGAGRWLGARATPPSLRPSPAPLHWGLKAMREGRGFARPRPLPLAPPPSLGAEGESRNNE